MFKRDKFKTRWCFKYFRYKYIKRLFWISWNFKFKQYYYGIFKQQYITRWNYIIKDKIENYENIVKPSIFKSKEEWKTELSESSDRISEILNELNGNPLSDTIEVKVKSLNLIEETANYIEKIDKVDRVQYSQTLASENVEFIDNIISNNETRKIQNFDDGVATLYRFDNLSIISCNNNNVYIGTKELSYNDSFCK